MKITINIRWIPAILSARSNLKRKDQGFQRAIATLKNAGVPVEVAAAVLAFRG